MFIFLMTIRNTFRWSTVYQENLRNRVTMHAITFVLIASLHGLACDTDQVFKDNSVSDGLPETDQVQRPVIEEPKAQSVNGVPPKEIDVRQGEEVCEGDHYLENKFSTQADEDHETKVPLHGENDEKIKYSKSKNLASEEQDVEQVQSEQPEEDSQFSVSGDLIRRSMQGLEEMLGRVEKSSVKVFEKLGGVMDQVGLSREQVMKSLDTVMDRVSESVSKSKVQVIKSFDSVMDQVSASKTKMMEEIDHVIDKVAHSKVIEEIRALPGEIRESFVLSVRNRSYVAAGVMVAITTAVLVAGAVYYAWCHHDAWSYHRLHSADEHVSQNRSLDGAVSVKNDAVLGNGAVSGVAAVANGHAFAGSEEINMKKNDGLCSVDYSDLEVTIKSKHSDMEVKNDLMQMSAMDQSQCSELPDNSYICEGTDDSRLKEISKEDAQHQNNLPNKSESQEMLDKSEQQNDCSYDRLSPEDMSHEINGHVDLSLRSEPTSVGGVDFEVSEVSLPHSVVCNPTSEDKLPTQAARSSKQLQNKESTNVEINPSPALYSVGNAFGKGDEKQTCQIPGVDSLKLGADGSCGEGVVVPDGDSRKLTVSETALPQVESQVG